MNRRIAVVVLAMLACQSGDRNPRSFRDRADNAIYKVVLDSFAVVTSTSDRVERITLHVSTDFFPAERTPAWFTAVFRRFAGVDSTTIHSFMARNETSHPLGDLRRVQFRAPLILVSTDSMPVAPIADGLVNGELVALPPPRPDPFWTAFRARYPDSDGYVIASSIGYNAAQDLAIVAIERQSPDEAPVMTAILLRATTSDWRIIATDTVWPR
jgi:hypothetical protein